MHYGWNCGRGESASHSSNPGRSAPICGGGALEQHDAMVAALTEEHRVLYAPHLAGTRKLLGRMQKLAADPQKVVDAVDHALTARRPKSRYLLDASSRIQKTVMGLTPTPIRDAVLAAATTSKRRP